MAGPEVGPEGTPSLIPLAQLVDMKLEFGRHHGKILVADEICPDTCRFWDKQTREKLDKDRFRRDLGRVEEAYQEAARRICSAAA